MIDLEMARIRERKTGMCNGGWNGDSHPYLAPLRANTTIEVADIEGPAVITHIHVTKHEVLDYLGEKKRYLPRGIVLLVYYDDGEEPAVQVPLADFFCDGANGKADHFSNVFFEHVPESYNCYIPMPFRRSCRVRLRNDTPFTTSSYCFVEYEKLDGWDDSLGYFHAAYNRVPFQLKDDTVLSVFSLDGKRGHLVGRQLSISTNEPAFRGFIYLCEGNNEVRVDTDEPKHHGPYARGRGPTYDYLGSEDAFGFSWGWNKFLGTRVGCPYYATEDLVGQLGALVRQRRAVDAAADIGKITGEFFLGLQASRERILSELSVYRFFAPDAIRFTAKLDWKVNWTCEYRAPIFQPYRNALRELGRSGDRLWVDFANVMYWYQNVIGHRHDTLPPFEQRI